MAEVINIFVITSNDVARDFMGDVILSKKEFKSGDEPVPVIVRDCCISKAQIEKLGNSKIAEAIHKAGLNSF